MAQWAKPLAVKFDDISMVSTAHMGEGELAAASCPLTSVCMLWYICACLYTYVHTHAHKIIHKTTKTEITV